MNQTRFKPMLFSTDMVEAILEGRKTMTRRIRRVITNPTDYQVGDVLWVRETWQETTWLHPSNNEYGYIYKASENGKEWAANDESWKWKPSLFMPKKACRLFLEVTEVREERLQDITRQDCIDEGIGYLISNWERRSGIGGSWYDYERKTFLGLPSGKISPSMSFMSLWRSINGPNSWDENPWVVVISFKRIEKPEGFGIDNIKN
jgi:hypothetical protein